MNSISLLFRPEPLHIPDGFLSLTISLLSWLITIVLLAIAVRRSQHQLDERQIPLMGVMAAFIFAAQMINFPVAGGTSGHMLGGALAACLLGASGYLEQTGEQIAEVADGTPADAIAACDAAEKALKQTGFSF